MLMLWMETSFITITVCLWQEFHSRTCTKLSLWWIPYLRHTEFEVRNITAHLMFVPMYDRNQSFNSSPMRRYNTALPTQKMEHILTSGHRGCGKDTCCGKIVCIPGLFGALIGNRVEEGNCAIHCNGKGIPLGGTLL